MLHARCLFAACRFRSGSVNLDRMRRCRTIAFPFRLAVRDLNSPLVMAMEAGLGDHLENALGRACLAQEGRVAAVGGQAILACGHHDDGAALADNLAGGAHALDRLVEILRVAGERDGCVAKTEGGRGREKGEMSGARS